MYFYTSQGSPNTKPLAWPKLFQQGPAFPAQEHFMADPARFVYVGAAVRTGKTWSAIRKALGRIRVEIKANPRKLKRYWFIAPTHHENIAQKIELNELIPDHQIDRTKQRGDRRWKDLKHGHGALWLKGNALIEFKSSERPESLVSASVEGIQWTEIARSKQLAWGNARTRLSNTNGWLIADTSPYGRCWFYQQIWEPAREKLLPTTSCYTWTAHDSPFISEEEIEAARISLPSDLFRRDYEADWSSLRGQIYSNFQTSSHVLDKPPFRPEEVVIGVDLNTAATRYAAFVVLLVGGWYKDPMGCLHRRAHVAKEYTRSIGLDYEGYAHDIVQEVLALKQHYPKVKVVIDPSVHNEFKAMIRARGVRLILGKNSIQQGIRTMGSALSVRLDGLPLLSVDPGCENWLNEIRSYTWIQDPKGVLLEVPDKSEGSDDLMDATRYACMEIFSNRSPWSQIR